MAELDIESVRDIFTTNFPNQKILNLPKVKETKNGKIFEFDDFMFLVPNNVLECPSRLENYLIGLNVDYCQINELEEKIKISDSIFDFLIDVNSKYSLQSKKHYIKEVLVLLNEENISYIIKELEGLSEQEYSEKLSNIKYDLFKDLFK